MPKFSVIIPVYNVEKYIKKCLDSVFNQSFKDYEVIVVNDGTEDRSMDIVEKYDVNIINQKNSGLSSARNAGVKKSKGEYIIFLDSDDYWEEDLLKEIALSTKNNPDIVRFQIQEVQDNKTINKFNEESFENINGEEAFNRITKYHFVENAWCYAIKRKYYKEKSFSFKEGTIHEDFGLIPLVIIKANAVNSIPYIGYNYVQRSSSIMNTEDYKKTKKKVSDFYNHYKYLIAEIDKTSINSKVFKSFIANSLILKICELKGKDYKEYKSKLKEDKVIDNILSDTISRKIKKILIIISPRLYSNIKLK
ncbi:MAG: glycosyltransferase [Bacilli bacterium]|nr:glycosyltransferase [Bacilli bacterium]